MGQQQLLIVILVSIIIGIAAVVAITTMQETRTDSIESALRQDILMVLNDAQTYYRKPESMGGGGQSFDGINQNDIMSINPQNENGTYQIYGSGDAVTVDGTGTDNKVSVSATADMTTSGMEISWSVSTN